MTGSIEDLYYTLRPRAFAIAYRMLGSASEAEDVVQEAFIRLHRVLESDEPIDSPQAYLSTLVTRLAIDQLRSARARRENYVGEWLPEPVTTESNPADQAETADSLSLAFLVLLESLTPPQRAAFLLREVFEYPYTEIAEIIGTDVDGTRHLVARARNHLRNQRPRYRSTHDERRQLALRFLAAAEHGELAALEELLAPDATLHADGGGKVPAQRRPISGRERVARALSRGIPTLVRQGGRIVPAEVNGHPGAVVVDGHGERVAVVGLTIRDGAIQAIHAIANPDKLRHLDRAADLAALLRDDQAGSR